MAPKRSSTRLELRRLQVGDEVSLQIFQKEINLRMLYFATQEISQYWLLYQKSINTVYHVNVTAVELKHTLRNHLLNCALLLAIQSLC